MKTFLPFLFLVVSSSSVAETRTFRETAVEMNGVRFWIPSVMVVKKGDTVKIHAVSKIPGANNVHGLSIDAFKIQEVIDAKGKEILFTADKVGIFDLRCHLHPVHVGGQLIVLE